jgi:hypothetical protein
MRRTILFSFFVLLVMSAANDACAQSRGGARPGFARGGHGFHRARFVSPYGFGYGYSGYDDGAGYDYAAPPAYFVQPQPLFVQAPAPPAVQPVGHPVITEYKWPAAVGSASAASTPSTTSESEPKTLAIVLKNGSTLSAVSVFASDDGLHYEDPDARHLRVSMSEVDRAATLKLNRARNLDLYLPAAQ